MALQQNRPLNSQNVADALQKFNLKKTAVQKPLDALADSGQISFKECGKKKVYIAQQDQFDIPNGEELEEMKKANAKLQEELADQKKAISEVESEVRGLLSNLTLAEIKSKETKTHAFIYINPNMYGRLISSLCQGTYMLPPGAVLHLYIYVWQVVFDDVPANQVRTSPVKHKEPTICHCNYLCRSYCSGTFAAFASGTIVG